MTQRRKAQVDMFFVDLDLARRLEMAQAWRGVHYANAQLALRPETYSTVEAVAGGFAIYAGEGSPLNKAVGLGMYRPVTQADLEHVERFYRSRNAAPRVSVCPLAEVSLVDLLNANGYRLESFYSVLFRLLTGDDEPMSFPPGIHITQAKPKDAELWIRTTGQGFTGQEIPPQEDIVILSPNFYAANATCLFAWIDGQPAGGGGMYIHEGVAEFGGASTRPAFRKRGVQTALLHARMDAARKAGCDLALVVTPPGEKSQRNVERVGFRLAYTKVVVVGLCGNDRQSIAGLRGSAP
jgi:GNAT superfamily N-acetyltransferase